MLKRISVLMIALVILGTSICFANVELSKTENIEMTLLSARIIEDAPSYSIVKARVKKYYVNTENTHIETWLIRTSDKKVILSLREIIKKDGTRMSTNELGWDISPDIEIIDKIIDYAESK